ncbi:hypothetical protein CPC08DRAFT_432947 [Agrocybe pediades]|nr:hypothetical protein CPC08DRAFT_432947 [Agrocybe pediades]
MLSRILIDRSARTEGANLLLDLIRNTPMMEVCAAALQLLNRTDCMPKASDSSWILVLTMITALVDFRECSIAAGRLILRPQHYAYIQEVSEAVKTIIRSIASPVLHSLRPCRHRRRVDPWKLHRAEVLQRQVPIPHIRNMSSHGKEIQMRGMPYCFLLRQRVPDTRLEVSQERVQKDAKR